MILPNRKLVLQKEKHQIGISSVIGNLNGNSFRLKVKLDYLKRGLFRYGRRFRKFQITIEMETGC
jgi:hypothetical protein